MTRKRFIKLMMADGYSRNEAMEVAQQVQGVGSYVQTYLALHVLKTVPSLQAQIEQLAETCGRVIRAFADALGAFTRTFNESMDALRQKERTDDGVSKG